MKLRLTHASLPLVLSLSLVMASSGGAQRSVNADPPWYQRQASWEETVRVSREALGRIEASEDAQSAAPIGDFRPSTHVLEHGQEPLRIRIPVHGLPFISIASRAVRGEMEGVLGEPKVIAADGTSISITRGQPNSTDIPQITRFPSGVRHPSPIEGPIEAADRRIADGIQMTGVNGEAFRIRLDGKYQWLEAWLVVIGGKQGDQMAFDIARRGTAERGEALQPRRDTIWTLVRRDFQTGDVVADNRIGDPDGIFSDDWKEGDFAELARRYASHCIGSFKEEGIAAAPSVTDPATLAKVRALYEKSRKCRDLAERIEGLDIGAARLAIEDMGKTFPESYDLRTHQQTLDTLMVRRDSLLADMADGKTDACDDAETLLAGMRRALLDNPLLDPDRILLVRRDFAESIARRATDRFNTKIGPDNSAGLVSTNFYSQASMRRTGFNNEVAVLSGLRSDPKIERFYKSPAGELIRDMRLDYDAGKLLFSMPVKRGGDWQWAVHEMAVENGSPQEITPTNYPDLHFFNACYLPDGRLILASNASYVGILCLGGTDVACLLYLYDPRRKNLRQLTFDQDHNHDPIVLADGRVMFVRWEYSEIPHYFSRRLMTMNPDGTGQTAIYGSGSWFPTAMRFPQPVPGHPGMLATILTGHHDHGEAGRLALMNPSLATAYPFRHRPETKEWGEEGRHIVVTPEVLPAEKTGFVQYVPGRGKDVPATVCDNIVEAVFLKERPDLMTHPLPLSEKYFLVSMKPKADGLWGIYLVDTFDNITLIAEIDGSGLFEPTLLQARPRPPVIPDKVDVGNPDASILVADVYTGVGLKGVPRGTVKTLRVFAYHFGYHGRAGFQWIGENSGWDVKRVLGTATVEADGSAHFTIPANTPVALQPLDAEGRAVQLMRSWTTAMPGETMSCAGCHEGRSQAIPPPVTSIAALRGPETLKPWYGKPRPFGFSREVQPVLQRYCIGCHDQGPEVGPRSKPSFRSPDESYAGLHPYVHRPGPEADMTFFNPMEYHATTSPLIQMLEKGHHGVRLDQMDRESRDRLYTWIDLNAPKADSFEQGRPIRVGAVDPVKRRTELAKEFAYVDVDPEQEAKEVAAYVIQAGESIPYQEPPKEPPVQPDGLNCKGFPMSTGEAVAAQKAAAAAVSETLSLGNDVSMVLKKIPAGSFVMGSLTGAADERPRAVVDVTHPFWIGETEITNAQYACFDPEHDTRYIDMHSMNRVTPGFIANHANQPVARVSWQQAMAFCDWLSRKTGRKVSLPTEAQWEWAARVGTETQFHFGAMDADWSPFANLADQSLRWLRPLVYPGPGILQPRLAYPPKNNFPLRDERFKDAYHVVDYVGQTTPNAWGVKDMVGNVSEWTRSSYRPYPYKETDGRNDLKDSGRKVARGGSWADRPADAGSSVRRAYEPWQKVYDVGFRIIVEE